MLVELLERLDARWQFVVVEAQLTRMDRGCAPERKLALIRGDLHRLREIQRRELRIGRNRGTPLAAKHVGVRESTALGAEHERQIAFGNGGKLRSGLGRGAAQVAQRRAELAVIAGHRNREPYSGERRRQVIGAGAGGEHIGSACRQRDGVRIVAIVRIFRVHDHQPCESHRLDRPSRSSDIGGQRRLDQDEAHALEGGVKSG